MRLAIAIILSTALAVPVVAVATGAPGLAAPKVTDFSSEEKKKKKKAAPKKKTEDNLKTAPTEPPKENKSTY
jgi:hypothetical protein